jgi:hypothetical protein
MTEEGTNFLKLLFNEGESICVTSGKYGAHSIEQSEIGPSIPLKTPKKEFTISDTDILLVGVNPMNGWKRDSSVTDYRNFMLEFDDGSLESQMTYVKNSGIPYSACVFSGNKSLHFAVALTQGYSESIWRFVNQWILNILTVADQQNKSPSRGIRFPGNMRKDGAKKPQKLLEMNKRITQSELNNWLSKHTDKKPQIERPQIESYGKFISEANLPPFIVLKLQKLQSGEQDSRNSSWFKIASYFAKNNASMESALNICETYFIEENDFKRSELMNCIKSAYRKNG